MKNNIEYILCAAIKRLEPKECQPYHNNDICNIEIGYRHHDIFQRFPGEVSKHPDDQGFYTSRGRFVDRNEAMLIAWWAGQVDEEKALGNKMINLTKDTLSNVSKLKDYINKLYSEDLY